MTSPAIASQQQTQPANPQAQPAIDSAWRYSETALIGCILQSGAGGRGRQTFAEAVDTTGIFYSDFYSIELRDIWIAMMRLYANGAEIDLSTVWAEIQKSENAKNRVTYDMLAYLATQKVGGHRTHAENIVDASISNSAENAINKLMPIMKNPKIKASEKLRRINAVVTELSKRTDHATKSQTVSVADGLAHFVSEYDTAQQENKVATAITTGFPAMDAKIDGWRPSTLHVIAGAPGSGKTVFLATSALHAVMAGKRVLMVQLELPLDQCYRRLLCAFAGIDSNRLKRQKLQGWEQSRLTKAIKKLKSYDDENTFTLLTMNRPTLSDIEIKLDTLMLSGYDAIFLDYAGGARIASENNKENFQHHEEIYTQVDSWKKRYNVPIIAGAQYSHPSPQKHPGGYTQDMIYSSSFFKHNADTITFLHPNKPKDDGKLTTSLAMVKIRDGESNYGSNTIVNVTPEMNMFRFVPQDAFASGPPPPLWDIHEANKPATVDLGDL